MPNTGSGAGHDTLRHTSRAKPSILPPELFSLRSKAWALSGFGASAWLPGSECALSPSACVVVLNSRVPVQLPLLLFTLSAWSSEQPGAVSSAVVPCALRYPRQVASRWWARVVGRWLCFCAHRVGKRCAAHPPRAGGQKTKLDPRGSGLGFAGRSGRPGGASRGDPHSDRTGGAAPGKSRGEPL